MDYETSRDELSQYGGYENLSCSKKNLEFVLTELLLLM